MHTAIYESKKIARIMIVWSFTSMLLAVVARIGWSPLMDMPLFCLMFISALGIVFWHMYQYLCGWQSSFVLMLPMPASRHISLWLLLSALWGIGVAALVMIAMLVCGHEISRLLTGLSFDVLLLLFGEIFLSFFFLLVTGLLLIQLIQLLPFRNHKLFWALVFVLIHILAGRLAAHLISQLLPGFIVIGKQGLSLTVGNMQENSFSFSLSTFIWQLLCAPFMVFFSNKLLREKLIVEY